MVALAGLSIWLKGWLCRKDKKYLKRKKRLIEELYAIATGVVVLCAVTAVQFLLLGKTVDNPGNGTLVVQTAKLFFAAKLAILTVISLSVLVMAAAARTGLGRLDIALALDDAGLRVPPDIGHPFPRFKKGLVLGLVWLALLVEFYVVSHVFSGHVYLLRY